MASEDITFCANMNCLDTECFRNPKNIKLLIPHSFSLFPNCKKWDNNGANWLTEQIDDADKN